MDKLSVKFYRERWNEVYEIEARERAGLSTEEKLRQLSILFEFARAVRPSRSPDYAVIERWLKLEERLRGPNE